MEDHLIESNFPLIATVNYQSGFSTSGSFYEAFFKKDNTSSLIVIPGDGFGSWAYRQFASLMTQYNINVFLLNFPSHFKSHRASTDSITNRLYFEDIKASISFITEKFELYRKAHIVHYLGHSRGAYILQAICSEKLVSGIVILDSPLIYCKKIRDKVSVFHAVYIIYKSLWGGIIRLPFHWFRERFFGPALDEIEVKKYYQLCDPFFSGILFSRLPVSFSELIQKNVYFILRRQDQAVNLAVTLKKLEILKTSYKLDPIVYTIDGSHCDLITNPEISLNLYTSILNIEI